MIRKIRRLLATMTLALVLLGGAVPALAAPAPAGGNNSGSNVFVGVCSNKGSGSSAVCSDNTGNNPITGTGGVLLKAVHILALISGAVAVIVIIVSGLRYVMSEGDPAKATQARNGIIYAFVGLIVIIVAQTIITFVLNKTFK